MQKFVPTLFALCLAVSGAQADKLKVLLIDGQNNHNWKATTPVLTHALESTGKFAVTVSTTPGKGSKDGWDAWRPKFSDYDVILSPTMAIVPPELGALSLSQPYERFVPTASGAATFTALFNITGQPAMSVPLHWSPSGLPVGVMFAGRFGDEATLFRLAAQLEDAKPWFERTPPL